MRDQRVFSWESHATANALEHSQDHHGPDAKVGRRWSQECANHVDEHGEEHHPLGGELLRNYSTGSLLKIFN